MGHWGGCRGLVLIGRDQNNFLLHSKSVGRWASILPAYRSKPWLRWVLRRLETRSALPRYQSWLRIQLWQVRPLERPSNLRNLARHWIRCNQRYGVCKRMPICIPHRPNQCLWSQRPWLRASRMNWLRSQMQICLQHSFCQTLNSAVPVWFRGI